MKKSILFAAIAMTSCLAAASLTSFAQGTRSTIAQSLKPPALPLSRVEDALIEFPLPKGEEAYGAIDGHKLHNMWSSWPIFPNATAMRDIPNSGAASSAPPATRETKEWLAGKFRALGLSDVRIQPLDLPPQWIPQSWDVTMTSGGKTIKLDSAQPDYYANGLPAGGVELDAVYAGLGTRSRFRRQGCQGQGGVRLCHAWRAAIQGGVQRADAKGAAVVFEVSMLPGNAHYQAYPSGTKAPAFTVGNDDGTAARQMIEAAKTGPRQSQGHLERRERSRISRPLWCGARCRARPMRPSTSWPTRMAGSKAPATMPAASPPCWGWRNISRKSRKPSASAP